jgi:TolB-like protein
MRKPRGLGILLLASCAAGCFGSDPYIRLARELTGPLGKAPTRVAVLPFRALDPALAPEGEAISERLLSRLYGRGSLVLIERSRLQQLMSEMSLGQTGALDAKSVAELGRLSGAQALVVGTVSRGARGLDLSARVVDVKSGRLLAAATARLPEGRNLLSAPPPPSRPQPAPAGPSSEPTRASNPDLGPGNRAPRAQAVFGAAAVGRRIYVFGGATERVGPGRGERETYSAPVGAGGALGRWRSEEPLPEGRYQVGAASWGRHVFAVGGYEGSPRSEVFAAQAGADGVLSRWTTAGTLPRGCTNPSALAAGGRLYVAGCSSTEGLTAEVYTAAIRPDGGLGRWTTVGLPHPAGACGLASDGGRILLLGGLKAAREFSDAIYSLPAVSEGRNPVVTRVGTLSVGVLSAPALVSGGRLWVMGGLSNGGVVGAPNFYRDVLESAPLGRDGAVGKWRRSPEKLSPAATNTSAPFVDGAFYLIGGETLTGRTDVVQRVPVGAPEGH